MNIQLYKNCKSPHVQSITSPITILLDIKNGTYNDLVTKARTIGKGNPGYDDIKTKEIPTCTWNFGFDKYKNNDNITNPTGLLFFDIDDTSFNVDGLDKNKIFSYYKSLGGVGYGILVKVVGLSLDNFISTYDTIVSDLGITCDTGARKATQYNVLSSDSSLFFNGNSYTYTASTYTSSTSNIKINKKRDLTHINLEEERIGVKSLFLNLRFEVTLESYQEDCVYLKEGKEFYNCLVPFDKETGKRRAIVNGEKHRVLSIYINNLMCLNPGVSDQQVLVIVQSAINKYCIEPIPTKNIIAMIAGKRKEESEGRLKPFGMRLKKYWLDPKVDNKLTKYHNKRSKLGFDAIDAFFGDELYNLSSKVTYAVITQIIGMSEKTIKRKITLEQKELMKEFNRQLKNKIR